MALCEVALLPLPNESEAWLPDGSDLLAEKIKFFFFFNVDSP